MNTISRQIFAFAAIAMTIVACKRDKEYDEGMASAESVTSFFEKSMAADEESVMRGPGGGPCNPLDYLPACVTVTESGVDYPKTITLDFGDGCTDPLGITRSGQLIISLTGDMIDEGSVRTVTFNDYSINGHPISGSRVTTNTGTDGSGHPTFSRVVDVDIIRDGELFQRNMNETVTWLSGYDTEPCGDNIFGVTGSGVVIRPDGISVTRTIIEQLIMDGTCGYITQGVVEVERPIGTATINFGDGTCDDIATVTKPNGDIITIELHP
ncbi:MAG: hypothetical protein JNM00_07560 [Flavobacteriales bacterium]|nr:hypothetical protein [Flavobacteriales bacterium]